MAHDLIEVETAKAAQTGADQSEQMADGAPIERGAPTQFGLRSLFVALAVCSGLFAVMAALDTLWSVVLLWSLLLILGHVVANAWGKQAFGQRLREKRDEVLIAHPSATVDEIQEANPASIRFRQQVPLGRGRILASIAGAISVGIMGGTILALVHRSQASWAALGVWVASSAVIGAFFGFIVSGIFEVFAMPLGEADKPGSPSPVESADAIRRDGVQTA